MGMIQSSIFYSSKENQVCQQSFRWTYGQTDGHFQLHRIVYHDNNIYCVTNCINSTLKNFLSNFSVIK